MPIHMHLHMHTTNKEEGPMLSNESERCYTAYAIGYYEGRAHGCYLRNPFEWEGMRATLYKLGYDRGVADFCAEELDTQEEA
jgi:hypothetical protein